MSFVEQEDIISTFEGMAKHLFKTLRGVELNEPFQRMSWADAMKYYGSDKPDLRFGMKFVDVLPCALQKILAGKRWRDILPY